MAFNLTRAAGALASPFHAKATTATIRRQLINVPARPVRSARRIHPAATDELALGPRLARPVHRRPRDHPDRPLPDHPARRPRPRDQWKSRADRRLSHARTALSPTQDQHDSTTIRSVHPGLARVPLRMLPVPAPAGSCSHTQVLGHLLIQSGLEHRLGELLEQPVRAGQRQSLLPG